MTTTAVFGTKPHDCEPLHRASANRGIEWRFLEFRRTEQTAPLAQGAQAVCELVNDQVDWPCLDALAAGKSFVEGSALT